MDIPETAHNRDLALVPDVYTEVPVEKEIRLGLNG